MTAGYCNMLYGAIRCARHAIAKCNECGQPNCPLHLKVCLGCNEALCYADGVESCYSKHTCKVLPVFKQGLIEREIARSA